jgi:PTH1 family peptidyl-tRNA hydrolase
VIKLIVGLGNPGRQYEKNRHNAGFLLLDRLAGSVHSDWSNESKFHGLIANCSFGGGKVILLKPQTFMNRSGLSVSAVSRYYKIEIEDVLVVHDELDLAVGTVRLKKGGGHAGHNGLRNISASLGGGDFYRIRLGVDRPASRKSVADYVLSDPSKEDLKQMDVVFDDVESKIKAIVSGDIALVMNELNRKKK